MFPSSSNNNNPLFSSYTPPYNHHDVASNPNGNNDDDIESTFSHGYPNSSFVESHMFTASHPHVLVEEEEKASLGATKKGKQTRKRATGKKDRHSKIYTAQGPRDRRMRLSLQIARKFFDLQDTLGFDKASKTIEWLFTKSKTAIKDLMSSLPHHEQVKRVSECQDQEKEVMEGVKNERKSRNTTLSKDCRDKARARARERTRDKMWRSLEKSKQCCFDANPNYLELGSSSSSQFEIIEESTSHSGQDMSCSTLKLVEEEPKIITDLLEHQMATVGIMDKLFAMRSRDHWTCTFTDDFLGFQQDWSMGNNNNNARSFHSNYGSTPNHDIDTVFSGHDDVHHQHENPISSSFKSTSNIHLQHPHFLADH